MIEKINDEVLGGVAGGMSKDLQVAYLVLRGDFGNGAERRRRLEAAGYDYDTVQNLVNGLAFGDDKVAIDVINGKYGNGETRRKALRRVGCDPNLVQDIVDAMLVK